MTAILAQRSTRTQSLPAIVAIASIITVAFMGSVVVTPLYPLYQDKLGFSEITPDERRSEVVSTYFIACFVGNSVPVIGIGVLTTLTDSLVGSIAFATTIATLAVAALIWLQSRTPDHAGTPEA